MGEFAGSLRERVAIDRFLSAPDDSGGDAGAWVEQGSAWAAIVPTESNATPVVGEARVSRQRFRLTLRNRPGLGLASRFRWGGRVLIVVRPEPDPRAPDRLTLLVEERT